MKKKYANFTRDVFYVRTKRWKDNVRDRGIIVFDEAIKRSSE